MSLQLRVLTAGDCSVIEGETRICNGPAFTIGRGPDNDWVLLDAQRYLSKNHCRIERSGGGYRVVDTSTNGVYVGDAAAPIGRGNAQPVENGDTLNLGSCVIRIEIGAELAAALGGGAPEPVAQPSLDPATHPIDFEASSASFAWSGGQVAENDYGQAPFEPISGVPGIGIELSQHGHSSGGDISLEIPGDNPGVAETFFRAPEILRPAIPVDWQADAAEPMLREVADPAEPIERPEPPAPPIVEPAPLRRKALADAVEPPPRPNPIVPPAAVAPPAPVVMTDVDARRLVEAFLDGAALPIDAFDLTDPAATMRKIGQAFREAVGGIRELLESRAMLKAEFRLEHTLVRARDNNPLKFSTNLDGTLAVMLGRRVPGFMEPPEAIRESVRDVKAHEIAMMAGLKAALAGQLEQLSPALLRAQAEKAGGGGILPHAKKARLWERFEELHEQMSTEQVAASPVGRHFAEAYSTQYRKI